MAVTNTTYLKTKLSNAGATPLSSKYDSQYWTSTVYSTNNNWYLYPASDDAGFGTAPKTSVTVLNYLPLGHYRIEESWNKEYLNLNSQISILVEEKNNTNIK